MIAFLKEADRTAPLESCVFNIGANVNFLWWKPPNAYSARHGRWRATPDFGADGKRPG